MSKFRMFGVEKVEIGDCGADGIMGTSLSEIDGLVKDSVIFEIPEPDITEIEIENADEPDILDINKAGVKSVSLETRNLSLANFAKFLGGEVVTDVSDEYQAPVSTTKILQSVKLTGKYVDGNRIVISIPKAFVYGTLGGEMQRSETGRLGVNCRVMTPYDGSGDALPPYTVAYEAEA